MVNYSQLRTDYSNIEKEFGSVIRIRYYTSAINGSYYDDNASLSKSGSDLWTSGIIQPLSFKRGSYDSTLLEQGKILENDSVLYILGTIQTSGIFKIGLGSPVVKEYTYLNDTAWRINDDVIYKKLYVRYLPNGSLTGE